MVALSDAELQQPREHQYEVALAGVADAVIVVNSASEVTYLNLAAGQIIGRPMADILGQPLAGVLRIRRENEGAAPASLFEALRQGVKKIDLIGDTSLLSPGGRRIPIEGCASPICDTDGQFTGAVIVFRDVADRRAVERALQSSEESRARRTPMPFSRRRSARRSRSTRSATP
ncbi:MAG: PAS domain-containing protein [Steroidobacteraceae bacterium]